FISFYNHGSSQIKLSRKQNDSIAKSQVPLPGNSVVYIIRSGLFGGAVDFRLDCDSFFVGKINSNTYLYTVVDSGDYVFKAHAKNNFNLKVHLEGGKIYYYAIEAKMGIMTARTKLKDLTDTEGTQYLSKYLISRHNRYPGFTYSRDEHDEIDQ
ncbi:MAG: hypothetical protein M3N30_10755, partial [Bacteroidota bacterium]|nr:hypothetical protein [Bacteroidota bacterium]